MRLAPLALVALLAVGLLAGCADKNDPAPATDTSFDDVEVSVTDTTGVILGVVVDDAIRPLENVEVKLQGAGDPVLKATDVDGRFVFDDLEPGTYFLQVSKFGYFPQQSSADVVAGVKDPPVVRVQLLRDVGARAYFSVQEFKGFIVCTSSVVAVCGAPNVVSNVLLCSPPFNICLGNVTEDRFGWDFFYEANSSYIQTELFWKSTQSLSTQLSLQMETIEGCDAEYYERSVSGNSPLMNYATAEEIAAAEIGGECSIWHSIFSGGAACAPVPMVGDVCAGATVQQQFDAYTHSFYGYLPPEGWLFSKDGDPPVPQ